jgi:PQQ-like domain
MSTPADRAPRWPRPLTALLVAAATSVAAGCTSPATTGAASKSPATTTTARAGDARPGPAASDWLTYHRTADRAGNAPGVPRPTSLTPQWTARLDGAVYGQPLVVGSSGPAGTVLVATENDTVTALDLTDGRVRWSTSVGTPSQRADLPCGNIDPLGITGTPAYDPATGTVFVAAQLDGATHDLVALDAATGAIRWRTGLDVVGRQRRAHQQRGALAVANGRVYVPFGGLAGDCGDYVGYVTATPTAGPGAGPSAGPTTHYEVPTTRMGGIWAPSGVAVDGAGDVWVAVGNGASTDVPYDGSDSVLRLAPDLSHRLDFFAPRSWGAENAADADLGSTGPLLTADGVLVSGKTGDVYLLDPARLGGIGGEVARAGGCTSYGGMAWDAATRAAFLPCTQGLRRFDVRGRALLPRWQADGAIQGSPVLGGGAAWSLETGSGVLHVLDAATGHELARADVGPVSRFASPVLTGAMVLVGTLDGVSALRIAGSPAGG